MGERYEDYQSAFNAAVKLARTLGREVGILRTSEFGKDGYNVYHLPSPKNRSGFELRCQVVRPDEPLMG